MRKQRVASEFIICYCVSVNFSHLTDFLFLFLILLCLFSCASFLLLKPDFFVLGLYLEPLPFRFCFISFLVSLHLSSLYVVFNSFVLHPFWSLFIPSLLFFLLILSLFSLYLFSLFCIYLSFITSLSLPFCFHFISFSIPLYSFLFIFIIFFIASLFVWFILSLCLVFFYRSFIPLYPFSSIFIPSLTVLSWSLLCFFNPVLSLFISSLLCFVYTFSLRLVLIPPLSFISFLYILYLSFSLCFAFIPRATSVTVENNRKNG